MSVFLPWDHVNNLDFLDFNADGMLIYVDDVILFFWGFQKIKAAFGILFGKIQISS